MPPLFVYGTLLSARVRNLVIGRALPAIPARLSGYRRVTLSGRDYPGLVPAPQAAVEGRLVEGLGIADLARLDRYEGDEYRRCLLRVSTASGPRHAWVYLPRPDVPVSRRPWSPPDA